MEKIDAAFIMYKEGATQKEIAKMLRVSENTISSWSKKSNWREKKISHDIKHENSIEIVMELIEYQTGVLKRTKDSYLDEDPETLKNLDKGHIDSLTKLFACVKRDVKKFTDFAHVMSEYMNWLKTHDLDLAKQQIDTNTEFLNEMRKKL